MWNRLLWPLNTPSSTCLRSGVQRGLRYRRLSGQHDHRSQHRSGRRHLPVLGHCCAPQPVVVQGALHCARSNIPWEMPHQDQLPEHTAKGSSEQKNKGRRSERGNREKRNRKGHKAQIRTCDWRLLSPAGYRKTLWHCCHTSSYIFSSW